MTSRQETTQDDEEREMDPENASRQLSMERLKSLYEDAVDDLLAQNVSPQDSADKTAALVTSQVDVSGALTIFIGVYLQAAERMANEPALRLLVDYIVALASLPDAYNEGPGAKELDIGGGEIKRINPGEAIEWYGGKLWRDLPGFSMEITERFQGPELYLNCISSPVSPETAKARWRNFNTFLALLARNRKAQDIPALSRKVRLSFVTLAMALEHSPTTRLGVNVAVHAPAAAQWLRIAGDEIEKLCADGTERMSAGDLWLAAGGSEVCDTERLKFWKERLTEVLHDGYTA